MATKAAPAVKSSKLSKPSKRSWSLGPWRMRSKMVVILFLVSQVPLLAVSAFTIITARRALLDQASINMLSVSTEVAREVDSQLLAWRENIRSVSLLPEIVGFASKPTEAAAKVAVMALKAEASKRNVQSIAVVNREGKIVLASVESDLNSDISFRPYFLEALKGAAYISDPSVSVITGKPSIFASAPVLDANNQVIAVVRSRLDLYGIWDLVEQAAVQSVPGTIAMLLDNDGIRIAHSASRGNREGVVNTLLYRAIAPLPPETTKAIVAEKRFGTATTDQVNVLPLPEVAAALRTPQATTFAASADNSSERHQ